jgi:hypothetical protein
MEYTSENHILDNASGMNELLQLCKFMPNNCDYYNGLCEDVEINDNHMERFFHIDVNNYNKILELIALNKLVNCGLVQPIFKNSIVGKTKYGVYIFTNDMNHPEIMEMKFKKQNIGKHILERYFNNSDSLCFNIFKTQEYCRCNKIHIINNGIISVFEDEKNNKQAFTYKKPKNISLLNRRNSQRSRNTSPESHNSYRPKRSRSRSYDRSRRSHSRSVDKKKKSIEICEKSDKTTMNNKRIRTKEKIKWIGEQIEKLEKRRKKLNKKLELIDAKN